MPLQLVTPPTSEPVTLDEARTQLRIENGDDDEFIRLLTKAARGVCEARTGLTAIESTWKEVFGCWPSDGLMCLGRLPLLQVQSITYTDTEGSTQTLASDQYTVDAVGKPGVVRRAYGVTWPTLRTEGVAEPVTVNYTAGHATRDDVPEGFKHAMKLLIAHWYDNREAASYGTVKELPAAVDMLLASVSPGLYP